MKRTILILLTICALMLVGCTAQPATEPTESIPQEPVEEVADPVDPIDPPLEEPPEVIEQPVEQEPVEELEEQLSGDAGSGEDASKEQEDALRIELNKPYVGSFNEGDKIDFYKFFVDRGTKFDVSVTPKIKDLDVVLNFYDDEDHISTTAFKTYDLNRGKAGEQEVFTFASSEEKGFYFVKVQARPGTGEYDLMISAEKQDDAGSGSDAGQDTKKAAKADKGTHTGFMGYHDLVDWYAVEDLKGVLIEPNPDLDIEIKLFNEKGVDETINVLRRDEVDQKGQGGAEEAEPNPALEGITYVHVEWNSGAGSYDITFE